MSSPKLILVFGAILILASLPPTTAGKQRRQPRPRPFPTASPQPDVTDQVPDLAGETPSVRIPVQIDEEPTETMLGFPIYPNADYITSYDAGRGQRYYLFGTNSPFRDMVQYYKVILDERGNQVFNAPATHIFEIGKFREDSMAFPPGVTIKDYAWNGSAGYPNPVPGAQPENFRTIIQIVPAPRAAVDQ